MPWTMPLLATRLVSPVASAAVVDLHVLAGPRDREQAALERLQLLAVLELDGFGPQAVRGRADDVHRTLVVLDDVVGERLEDLVHRFGDR